MQAKRPVRPSAAPRIAVWSLALALLFFAATSAVAQPAEAEVEAKKRPDAQRQIEEARAEQETARERIAKARIAHEAARADLAEAVAAEETARRKLAESELGRERLALEIAEARLAEAVALRLAAEAVAEREGLATDVAEMELRDALAKLERAEERLAEEARLVDLFRRANQLRSDEATLAARMEKALPLPASAFDLGPAELNEGSVEALLAERDRLRGERDALSEQLPDGAPIGAEPYALLLAEANFALHYARGPRNLGRAEELFRDASVARPDLPEPILGMGLAALRSGRAGSATELLRSAATMTRELRGEAHPDFVRALAIEREASLELTDADPNFMRQYQRSLDVLEPHWVEMSLLLAKDWTNAGDAKRGLGYALPAIEFAATGRGPRHPSVADAHAAAADGLKALGQWDAASEHVVKALEIRIEALGAEHPLTAASLNDAGSLSRLVGQPKQAETFFRQALEARAKSLGEAHPLVAATRNNVAMALMDQGAFAEAEEPLRRALADATAALGEKHPYRATLLCNLAACLTEQGKPTEASELYREAHLLRSESLGANHPLTLRAAEAAKSGADLSALLDAAEELYDAKKWSEGAAAFVEAAVRAEAMAKSVSSDDPTRDAVERERLAELRATCLYNACCCQALAGETSAAFALLDQAIDAGFRDIEHLKSDPDLESLRRDRLRFQKSIRRAEEAGE